MKTWKPGRPALSAADSKKRNLTFRCREEMRERLHAAAQKSRRSLSEEIENRLEQSFLREDRAVEQRELGKKLVADVEARLVELTELTKAKRQAG
jgi:Arc-like DNA binding dprotein